MEQKVQLNFRTAIESWKIEQNEFMTNQMTMQLIVEDLTGEKRRRMLLRIF